jgi:sulfite dehydrogenase (cytochrome) subunit B
MRFLIVGFLVLLGAAADAAPVHYTLPDETAALAPGPHVDVAQVCGSCHSVDYITTQPRGSADPHAFWSAEVAKMRKAFGAPVNDKDVAMIVDYLATTYR